MTTIDNTEFERFVLDQCPESYDDSRFPLIDHDEAGDCVEVFQTDEPHYGERIDERLTIYVGQESGDIVGVLVKGLRTWVARILTEYPGFELDINDNERNVLGILFHLRQLKELDPKLRMTYKNLSKVASSWRVKVGNVQTNAQQTCS